MATIFAEEVRQLTEAMPGVHTWLEVRLATSFRLSACVVTVNAVLLWLHYCDQQST